MKNNQFELDPERLGTTDEHGHRVYLYPESVKGVWKHRRQLVYWTLIGLYLVLPWFNVNGKPALQLNIFLRQFTFLGHTLYGVEPLPFFFLLSSGIFLIGFLTSLLGRVWCGWACPQTVFIQTIFWKIEQLVEGAARQRREREKLPLSSDRLWRLAIKWTLFLLVSSHVAHTFIGYFVGPRDLLSITLQSPSSHWGLFVATMILTAVFLFDFGWFREQFCIIACPYGRIQSVMMDENSLVVGYDAKRGEPRRDPGVVEKSDEGDCVNCYNCVKVCPTGIDIRRGTQLECIACTQCIDACDEVMTKIKRPRGLIRYTSENEVNGKPRRKFTARSLVYACIGLALISGFVVGLRKTAQLQMIFLRSATPFTVLAGGQLVSNQFTLKLVHQGGDVLAVNIRAADPALATHLQLITPVHPIVADKAEKKVIFFIRFPQSLLLNGTRKVTLEAVAEDGVVLSTKEVTLVGPSR